MKTYNFPFTCIGGQDLMKLGLLINVIEPQVGGVLLMGRQGTGKSTTVRSLAEVLPEITVVRGCVYNCNPNSKVEDLCPDCKVRLQRDGKLPMERRNMQVVNLPLGVTEEMVSGSFDVEVMLKTGKQVFRPGLLARANRGILYIDEVNLLQDHIVDLLLDAASSGINIVEREGFSFSHPARFILVGSMNPEEGELRPQINDRFGLEVEIRAPEDADIRTSITKMVLDFQENPREFLKKVQTDLDSLRDRIQQAKTTLQDVTVPVGLMEFTSKMVAELGIPSQRADITLIRCARAHAAYQGRLNVAQEDIDVALHLVLQHRLRLLEEQKLPEEIEAELKAIFGKIKESYVAEDVYKPNREDEGPLQASDTPQPEFKRNPLDENNVDMRETKEQRLPERDDFPGIKAENAHGYKVRNIPKDEKFTLHDLAPVVDHMQKKVIGLMKLIRQERIKSDFAGRGRRTRITSDQKGHYTAYRIPRAAPHSIAFDATVRDHLIRSAGQPIRFPIRVQSDSIKEKIFEFKAPIALYFILDASASMYKAIQQMADVILALQAEGYKKKDKISLLMFRGKRAHVLIRPTTNIHIALRKIRSIRGDSYTPMAQGLRKTIELVNLEKHKDKDLIPVIIICSDCGANISEKYPDLVAQIESDYNIIVDELRDIAKELTRRKIKLIVIEPRKAWSTKYVGVHPGSANAIKDNFRRYAKADIYEYDAWNPEETIICLKRQL